MKIAALLTFAGLAQYAEAHGRMISPPHRGYIGKLPKFKDLVPINYSDNGLSAGGISQTKGGKHGVCGDPYNGVRAHETGGTYGLFPVHGEKVIGACYAPGSTIDIDVQLTANHKGYFEFGLCKLNNKHDKESEECFQSLAQPNGQKQWPVPTGNEVFTIQNTLPSGVTCDGDSHCVLRWWYVGWNNPGVDISGQEQFWNCADIYISNNCGAGPSPSSKPAPSPSTPSPPSAQPNPSPSKPVPSSSSPTPAPPASDCGSCNNCYYAPTNSCFVGWNEAQCSTVSAYKWCGSNRAYSAPVDKVQLNGQCGGRHYTGPAECTEDAMCVALDEFYSECVSKSAL